MMLFLDVTGSKYERRKWVHAYLDVTAYFFVVSVADFDLDPRAENSIQDALTIFEEVANSLSLADTPVIVYLNKDDIFREKLKHVPFRVPGVRFDDYSGPEPYLSSPGDFDLSVDFVRQYITNLFSQKRRKKSTPMFVLSTTALDATRMQQTFKLCEEKLLPYFT